MRKLAVVLLEIIDNFKFIGDSESDILDAVVCVLISEKRKAEWISVKDDRPEQIQGKKILGYGNGYAFECECDDGFWCNIGGEEFTHWQPLPASPEQSND